MSSTKDFSSIGGLEKHIRIVKEMVLFPLMYGDVYAKFNLKPPRGLLFYGPPGTGKTLVASALAAECSNSERKVSFISRKGSDCLSKWVGESEKKLQKIFALAHQTKPCIIFFDEVDGLAPVRSSRQDFVHASIVCTLLALMDGLDNNSEIVVIGATNRIDAIDPALRRPGRFDRELYFPLPCYNARKDILMVHIKSWRQKPSQKFLAYLASKSIGFCGSDLQALCTEAVMCCVRRNYPQIYTTKSKYHINERQLRVEKQDFLKAQQNIVPASHRIAIAPIKSLTKKIQPLLQENLFAIMSQLRLLCPVGILTANETADKTMCKSIHCSRILLHGDDDSHTRYLGPALLHTLEHLPCHILDVTTLFEESGRAAEEAIILKMKAARHVLPSLLYVPDILAWWHLVDETARVVFTSLIKGLDQSVSMLILTTARCQREDLPFEILNLYDEHQGEVFEVKPPNAQERRLFFMQLFEDSESDDASNQSSEVNFVHIMSPKRTKNDNGKRQKSRSRIDRNGVYGTQAADIQSMKKVKSEFRTRNKFNTMRSCNSTAVLRPKVNVKREHNASGEGPVSKRSKLSCCSPSISSNEILSDPQLQYLLEKIVESTEKWFSSQLESLYSLLEQTLEKNKEDPLTATNECLSHLGEFKKIQLRAKKSNSVTVIDIA